MSVYFSHSGYADHHVETVYRSIEKRLNSTKEQHTNCGRRFQCRIGTPGMELNVSVLDRTPLKEENKRGDWMKQWLMIQNFRALDTMYRKTHEKQASCRSPKGIEKQLDYMLVDRQQMYCSRDACYDKIRDYQHQRRKYRQEETSKLRPQRAKMMTQRDLMKRSSSKSATQNSKAKSSMKPKLQPPHRKELLMLKSQALPHWNEDANASSAPIE